VGAARPVSTRLRPTTSARTWAKAVEKAGTFDPAAVIDAMIGVIAPNIVEQTPGLIVA
jgi:hypothetical protein